MRIIEAIDEVNLEFVEQEFDDVVFYEIYYLKSKIYQIKNDFDKAVSTWANAVKVIGFNDKYGLNKALSGKL